MSGATAGSGNATRTSGSPFVAPGGRPRTRAMPARRRIPIAPEEGWLTVLLVVLLVMPVAWSIDDARWVLGRRELTSFLPWAVIGGAAWGMLGAKVGWGRWTTHGLGAVMAALVVPILVGRVLVPDDGSLGIWFKATSDAVVEAVLDFTVRNQTLTAQVGHHLLVFGMLCWATAQFAGYAVLGHRRPLGAVFVTGLGLLTNMAVTRQDQMPFLVIFSLAALLLLVRIHADDERQSWLARRIGDPAPVTGLYLRGGATFVSVAVIGSLILTSTASSAPLAGAFDGFNDKLVAFGQQIERFLPWGGPGPRITGVTFGPTADISNRWETSATQALEFHVKPGDTTPYYWKAWTYDTFSNHGWLTTHPTSESREAQGLVLDGTDDQVPSPDRLRTPVSFTVKRLGWSGQTIFSPDAIQTVDRPTTESVVGNGRFFASLTAADDWETYAATALVPRAAVAGSADGFTVNNLRAASTVYPTEIQTTYMRRAPTGTLGLGAQALLQEIVKAAGTGNDPYDYAMAAVKVLQSAEFKYDTDITDLAAPCSQLSTVECFAEYKRGYCQYYATTMAVLLRELRIPTRFVQGWLPGARDVKTGTETVLMSNSHAWVEVYFPGYGWYAFDPTGNGLSQVPTLPEGPKVSPTPVPSTSPRPSGSDNGPDKTIRLPPNGVAGTSGTSSGPSGALLVVVAILLILVTGFLAVLAYRRGPRGPTQVESAWSGLTRLAGRFGWAPRPTQTPFEYAVAIGDILPVARADLHTVASAKVEVAYGRKTLDADRLSLVRTAQRKLRITLLRLVFRRQKRGPRGGRR